MAVAGTDTTFHPCGAAPLTRAGGRLTLPTARWPGPTSRLIGAVRHMAEATGRGAGEIPAAGVRCAASAADGCARSGSRAGQPARLLCLQGERLRLLGTGLKRRAYQGADGRWSPTTGNHAPDHDRSGRPPPRRAPACALQRAERAKRRERGAPPDQKEKGGIERGKGPDNPAERRPPAAKVSAETTAACKGCGGDRSSARSRRRKMRPPSASATVSFLGHLPGGGPVAGRAPRRWRFSLGQFASGLRCSSARSRRMSASSTSALAGDRDVYRPAAMLSAPATHSPRYRPASRSHGPKTPAATPTISDAVDKIPSLAPITAARSQPDRPDRVRLVMGRGDAVMERAHASIEVILAGVEDVQRVHRALDCAHHLHRGRAKLARQIRAPCPARSRVSPPPRRCRCRPWRSPGR